MKPEKIRNLTEAELSQQERDLSDQLFRLKFQLKMGQTESLKKIQGLRKDVARVKTIMRQRELAQAGASAATAAAQGGPGKKATAAPAEASTETGAGKKKAVSSRGKK